MPEKASGRRRAKAEPVDALSTAVVAIDGARRAGWAKAYVAEQTVDNLSRENNVLRGDRDCYRAGLSFLYGFFKSWAQNADVQAALLDATSGCELLLDEDEVHRGEKQAAAARANRGTRAERRAAWKAAIAANEMLEESGRSETGGEHA